MKQLWRGPLLWAGVLAGTLAGLLAGGSLFALGFVAGQSSNLGWGIPLGTTLAFAVACLSLGLTLYQTSATRRHNRLLVRPHLVFDSQLDSTEREGHHTYRLCVKNVGLGPAIFQRFSISLDDSGNLDPHTVFEEWVKLVNKATPAQGRAICKAGFLYRDHALDKNNEVTLLEVGIPADNLSFMQAREAAKLLVKKINATIEYRCHYGNRFKIAKQFHDEVVASGVKD